jgi:quercetin dioxygenase-like cupin family protein
VVYVVEGRGVAWEGDESTTVTAGDLVVVPRGVPHATVAADGTDLVLVCFFPHPDLAANLDELAGPVREAAVRQHPDGS